LCSEPRDRCRRSGGALQAPPGTAYLVGLVVVGIVSEHLALVHVASAGRCSRSSTPRRSSRVLAAESLSRRTHERLVAWILGAEL
jgi:hypothetical protein